MALTTAKGISVYFDEVCALWDANNLMARMSSVEDYPGALMQNSSNTVWKQVEQQSPVKDGWDMSASFGDVIEQSYPVTLGTPHNDAFQLRADDFRDEAFLKRRAVSAVSKLSADQNKRIAQLVVDTGSLAYEFTGTAGYDYLATAEAIMDESEISSMDMRCFALKPVNYQAISKDLAGRGTLSGRPEGAYAKSMVGSDIAGFDAYRLNAIPTLAEQTAAVTIDGAQTFAPVANTTTADGSVVPVDYRSADVTVNATAGVKRGDRFTIAGLNRVSLANKLDTGRLMTFSVVEVVDGTTLKIFPRPIALDDGALSDEEAAYANVTTSFANLDTLVWVNDNSLASGVWQPDVFWTKDSISIINGDAPFEAFSNMDGFKVVKETLDSGVTVYLMYQGNIGTATLQVRVFTWYGLANTKPTHNGIALPNFS